MPQINNQTTICHNESSRTSLSRKEKLQKTLLELLRIESEYPNETEVAVYIKGRLDDAGVPWEIDEFGNIIAKLAGVGRPVMLSTHMDIPELIPNFGYKIEGDVIRSDGNGILGVDPKSGLAILLELLSDISTGSSRGDHAPLEVVITRGEEKGLLGAKNLDYSLIESKIGLVLDEDGPVSSVVTRAPSCVYVDAVFTGKAAHPREPEKARNALQAASEAMASLPWGFAADGVMWNIGMFEAGTARNTVPGSAKLTGELRSYDSDAAQREAERIKAVLHDKAREHSVDCVVELDVDAEGYTHSDKAEVLTRVESTFSRMGIAPNYYATLGRSDANVFNTKGISTAAIGSGYYNAHQYSEYADLGDMENIYAFMEEFICV
jgi:tripeptide aminopeptidase